MFEFFKSFFRGSKCEHSPQNASGREQPVRGQPASLTIGQAEESFARWVADVRDYAVLLLDPTGVILTWNSGAERIKGYRREEIVGQHFSRFYPKEAVATGWPAHELEVATSTGRFEEESWRVRKDGSRFWANVVITAIRDESGLVGFLKITRDLTDRRIADERMRLSEERFRLMVETVRDYAIFMLDAQGRVATWNAGAERIKGYKAEEIIGQHFSRFYPREQVDKGWPEHELRQAAAEGRFEDEGWRVRKDGSQFWASVVITAVHGEGGALRGFAKITRDLTERKVAEENARHALQEAAASRAMEKAAAEIERQRQQLQVTLSSIGDAVIVTDSQGVISFLNPVAVDLTGWSDDEAAGRPLEDVFRIIDEQTRNTAENPVKRVLQEGIVVGLANHTLLVRKDGREIPIDDSGAPIRGQDNSITGVVLVFRDVSEARRAIEARLYLASIVESSDDAIISQNLDGTIASWNRGAERLYGYTEDEVLGRSLSILIPSDHPDEVPDIIERVKAGEAIEHFETQRLRRDGSRVHVSLTISPVRNAEGTIIGASKIARDITSRMEEDRRKNEFIALLAHELRNPLAPLRNALQVLKLAGPDQKTFDKVRTMMERQLEHLVRLVDDLLDVGRISQGKLQLRKERVSLSTVVTNALEVCEALARDQHRQLTVSLPDEEILLDADSTRLAQAVCNLLSNAVKYSGSESGLWLSARREGNEAVISVRDEGIGIAPQMLPKIFDLFMQVDRSIESSQGGLGVGLAVVKRLLEMHGGTVEARSEGLGRGSEFILRLPVEQLADPAGSQSDRVNHFPRVVGHRILVCDDNVDSAQSLAMLLTLLGHEVRIAHNGEEGFREAAGFHPDLSFLDLGMPGLNGFELCRRIREEPWGKKATIVALTGWGQEDDRRRSLDAGFDRHFVKPVEPVEIERLIAEMSSDVPLPAS